MPSLFLVPVDERSYQTTLAEPLDLSGWAGRPDAVPERSRIWGVRTDPEQGSWTRNRRNWKIMEAGDTLVFYRNHHSRYDAVGRVGTMFETGYIRYEYWNGGPATSVYTVEDYDDSIELEREEVNRILSYEQDFVPNGLWKVADDRPAERLIRRVGLEARR